MIETLENVGQQFKQRNGQIEQLNLSTKLSEHNPVECRSRQQEIENNY